MALTAITFLVNDASLVARRTGRARPKRTLGSPLSRMKPLPAAYTSTYKILRKTRRRK
jgi:hypothetical protein